MKKTLLGLALGGLVPLAPSASASVLLDGDELRLTYKNFYWTESVDDSTGQYAGSKRDEWVHAALVDYSTGYIGGWLKLDYGFAAADQLHIGADVTDVSNLPPNRNDISDPNGTAATQTAYLGTRFGNDKVTFNLGAGKKRRSELLYNDSNSRILPSTTVGYDLDANVGGLRLYYTEFDKHSPRNQGTWGESLKTIGGEKIDAVRYYGARYDAGNGLVLDLTELEAVDYIKERYAKGAYSLALENGDKLSFSLIWGDQQDAGSLFEYGGLGGYAPPGDLDAKFYDAGIRYGFGGLTLGLNYLVTRDDDLNRVLFSSDHGTWETSGNSWSRDALEDEQVVTASLGVNFAEYGVPGLSWTLKAAHSSDARGYDNFSRNEYSSLLSYAFQNELKGLSLTWWAVDHQATGVIDGVDRTVKVVGPAGLERKDANRLYLVYSRAF
ncbi:OprD family outer membrane porin [Marinobacterium rhizophilum]|uniref:OprD family outer membrane porin n=1 Tax=Marinobacterium rhizophilum TaxID=420402 RepID=A0ABY5HMH1_9GAMM|nr:OprD family outer membrane porin [Marinobacterium rhizophilum]UTW13463.1 OprD family outer membrane porin [Marinobacterium rhizophilum]